MTDSERVTGLLAIAVAILLAAALVVIVEVLVSEGL